MTTNVLENIPKDGVVYEFTPFTTNTLQNFKDKFYINNENQLLTNGTLDAETKSFYQLLCKVWFDEDDSLIKSQSFFVYVNIIDVNDERPIFIQTSYNFSAIFDPSATAYSIHIGDVEAIDKDISPKHRQTHYLIIQGALSDDQSPFFLIQATKIYTVTSLINLNGQKSRYYTITKGARDPWLNFPPTTVKVNIRMISGKTFQNDHMIL